MLQTIGGIFEHIFKFSKMFYLLLFNFSKQLTITNYQKKEIESIF
jgi:hypothetical protein